MPEQGSPITQTNQTIKIQEFNLGPFMFTVIWAALHEFWGLATLSIIPGVGFLIGLLLAFKGNAWAWQKDKFKHPQAFNHTQRKWHELGLIFLVVYSCIVYCIFSLWSPRIFVAKLFDKLEKKITSSVVISTINENQTAKKLLGEPITHDCKKFISMHQYFSENNKSQQLYTYKATIMGSKGPGILYLATHNNKPVYMAILKINNPQGMIIIDEQLPDLDLNKRLDDFKQGNE